MNDKVIKQLQAIEQQGQQLMVQRQGLRGQLIEVESALEELEGSDDAWRIVGNVMVKKGVDELSAELGERRDTLQLRLDSISKQESALREKAQSMQEELSDGQGGND